MILIWENLNSLKIKHRSIEKHFPGEHDQVLPTDGRDGAGVVSHAGGLLLTETVRAAGLDRLLTKALEPWYKPLATHHPGEIVSDLAVSLALGRHLPGPARQPLPPGNHRRTPNTRRSRTVLNKPATIGSTGVQFSEYRFRPDFCHAADPESKGIVENLVGYAKDDLLVPLELEQDPWADGLTGLNVRAEAWCGEVNARMHSEIHAVPAERLATEAELLGDLPSLRLQTGPKPITRKVDKLSCIRFGSARYSVPNRLIGATVTVLVDERDRVLRVVGPVTGEVHAEHGLVAPGETSIVDAHYDRPRPHTPHRGARPRTQAEQRNTNGLLRQYFPKDTDLSRWSIEEIAAIGWRTPVEGLPAAAIPRHRPVLHRPLEPAEYTSGEFTRWCKSNRVRTSLGRTGACSANAAPESLFAALSSTTTGARCLVERRLRTLGRVLKQ